MSLIASPNHKPPDSLIWTGSAIMSLGIFSYQAESSRIGQQQPTGPAKVNSAQANQAAEPGPNKALEQTPGPLERNGEPLSDPMKSLTPGRSGASALAIADKHNSSHPRTELPPALSDSDVRFRCFDHDCQGRTFSCAENYRRHLREKEGSAKVHCTLCGMSFTRKSNLRKHVSERRCQTLKPSETPGKASTLRSSHVPL